MDGTSNSRGISYEYRICMLCIIRGLNHKYEKFRLQYQVPDTGKFDDIVFDEGDGQYIFVQAKHSEMKSKHNEILHTNIFNIKYNANYNLLKYVKSIRDINMNTKYDGKIKMAIVFTNLSIVLESRKRLNLKQYCQDTAKTWYAGQDFINLNEICLDEHHIFQIFQNSKFYKFDCDDNILQILKNQAKDYPKEVGNLTEDEIRDALKYIVYAVNGPDDQQLKEIIKAEILKYGFNDDQNIYNMLQDEIIKWCDTKTGYFPPTITYENAYSFFQNEFKQVWFDVSLPVDSFVGRVEELEQIKDILLKENNVAISQTVAISGLGGIGKTQLAKQFIALYGKSDFYGRVVWISAENDSTVENTFRRLAEKIKLSNVILKLTVSVIEEVFDYFYGVKILFVFDNYDEDHKDNTQNFVLHCCKYVNQADKKFRPYFIFTSRRKECIPDISTIQLDIFTKEDAENLIKSELGKIKGLVLKHEEVVKLAETLQFFPLAIQQAIFFVRMKRKQLYYRSYTLKDYLSELETKIEVLLSHEYKDRFDKYGMATFSTFDVSLDAITSDSVNGQNAIEILQYIAYLYADEIDVKMFQKYVDKEKLSNVISLLESYSIISLKSDNPYFELGYLQIHRLVQSVVQNKFKEDEKNNIKNVIKIVIPKIVHSEYKKFKTSKDGENEEKWKIEVEHMFFEHESLILHIENLYAHVKKSHGLHQFYRELFDELRKKSFDEIAYHDDVESLKKLNMTKESLKKIAEQNIYYMLHGNHNRLVEYFVTSKLIDIQSVMSKHCLLHFAASEGNQEMIKLLIGNGANFENDDEYGNKPMHKAAYHGHLETIKYLINRGANCNVKNKDGETPIHYAAVSGQLKIIKFLIENGADFNVEDNKGVTPFYKAAFEGQAQVAKYLIEELGLHFLPPNSINTTNLDKYGNTPLHRAASDGNFEMVKGLIVQKSEDINATNYLGQTALHTAISQGYLNIVKYFFDEMDDFEDMKDYTGGTSIHIAASSGHLNIVEYLVKEKNVYALSKDKKYNNPLSRAVLEGHFEVVQFLAENKVCIYHNKHSQESSVDIAIFQGHLNIVKLFYEKHNLRGFYENDSLHIAIAKGYVDVIKYLIDKEKWNMYRRDDAKDNTLLHTAALEGQFDIVKYLLSKGADTKLKNRRGEIPLDLAKDTRVKELLMAR